MAAVATDTSAIGKSYPAVSYVVGREKVREFAYAVGETNPVSVDVEAARAAPPMFAVVYSGRAVWPAVQDPEVGLDFSMLVHGAQEFEWGPVVVAGDEISTAATIKDISERGGMGFYIFESVARNQRDETVCTGTWTNIVRGSE